MFASGHLITGAVIFHIGFLFDCFDGKLARWTGRTSEFGAWLDVVVDRIGLSSNIVALAYNQSNYENHAWLWYVIFLSFELVSTIGGKVVTLHESKKTSVHRETETDYFRKGSSLKFLYSIRDRLTKYRIGMPPVGSVEMIMLTLFYGPILDFPVTAAKIAAIVMVIYFIGISAVYWRKEFKSQQILHS